jgi:hypothetical protein
MGTVPQPVPELLSTLVNPEGGQFNNNLTLNENQLIVRPNPVHSLASPDEWAGFELLHHFHFFGGNICFRFDLIRFKSKSNQLT